MSDVTAVRDLVRLPGFLPTFATSRNAVLAKTGAGKSNAAVVLAEAMFDAGIPWVAIDPKGDWWGVRAEGSGAALPIPIFGGEHGDVPLEPTGGPVIANLIAQTGLTCVVDVSEFDTRQQMFRFLREFAETLLRRNREVVHVFAEEADDYMPQRTPEKGELPRCLGAWQRLAKKGRAKGIGLTIVSQRSAAVNKDALNMVDTLVAMRTTAPLDRKAIGEWFQGHGVDSADDLARLPKLANGEALVWSPEALALSTAVQFPLRRTFDSGATPKVGESRRSVTLADVDLDAVKAEMASTIERARQDDPQVLRARIRELESEVAGLRAETPVEVQEVRVPVPFVPSESVDAVIAGIEQGQERVREAIAEMMANVRATLVSEDEDQDAGRSGRFHGGCTACGEQWASETEMVASGHVPSRPCPHGPATAPQAPAPAPPRVPAPRVPDGDYRPRAGARRMLEAVCRFPGGLTRRQVGTLAKVKASGGTFSTYLSELVRHGLVEQTGGGDVLVPTEAGYAAIGGAPPPSDPAALRADWADRLGQGNGARRIFDALVASYPEWWDPEILAVAANIAKSGGSWSTYLSRLRSNRLIEEDRDGLLRAHPDLWLGAQ